MDGNGKPHRALFGDFEADLQSRELRRHGLKIRLQDQPFLVLAILIERAGQLVTREELRRGLWPADTFVDFEVGLNSAIRRLRDALGDSADKPRFIETLPRKGYRFIATVRHFDIESAPVSAIPPTENTAGTAFAPNRVLSPLLPIPSGLTHWLLLLGILLVAVAASVALVLHPASLRVSGAVSLEAAPIRAIAVLPLVNLTGAASQDYLADAMTDALITQLGQIRSLRVISRTSVMRYKGSRKSLSRITRELGVDGVVEGSVTRAGSRVHISAQLVRVSPERQLWAGAFEADAADLLTLEAGVARAVATQIRAELTPEEKARLAAARRVDPEVYEDYLKGRYYWNQRSQESVRKSIDYFKRALLLDPRYAPAYAGLADAYNILTFGMFRALPVAEGGPKAIEYAEKALALDPTLAEAHTALGFARAGYLWDWPGAERELQSAIDCDFGYATAYHYYALVLRKMGRRQESCVMFRRAEGLDPLSPNILRWVAYCNFEQGRFDRAVRQLQEILQMEPNQTNVRVELGRIYEQVGKHRASIAELKKAAELSRGNPLVQLVLAHAYASAGLPARGEAILRQMEARADAREFACWIAADELTLGRKEKAIGWLQIAYRARSPELPVMLDDLLRSSSLHSDPRYQALLRRMNLPLRRSR